MAAATGIWSHMQSAAGAPVTARPQDGTTGTSGVTGSTGSGSSSTDSTTISSNDFLTLLVTELQNQDPTADTDPNEYVNQLVAVNSLEQLIDINQTLDTSLGSSGASGSAAGVGGSTPGTSTPASQQAQPAGLAEARSAHSLSSSRSAGASQPAIRTTAGNLGIPSPNPSAQRVAQSLGGHLH